MADQLIAELESSAQVLLAPPNIITHEQRQCAENVFLNFRKTKSPVTLCQFILANSRCDYVKFQAASLLKITIIRDWSLLDKTEVETVRSGLLNFVIQNPTLQNYVREQLLLVIAIMVKRSSVDEGGDGIVGTVLTDVSQLISSGESTMQTIGCSVLTALLNEFSSTTRASDVGLTWETHLKAKKNFEKTDLKRLFQYCLQGLSELNKIGVSLPGEAARLFKKFLIIAEQVLTWNFQFAMLLPRKLIGIFESQQSPALRPSMEWHEVFMDPNVLQLFFKLHWQVREEPDLCHHTLQCLNQLASLNGTVMGKKDDRCNYIAWFVENLLKLLRSGPVKQCEALGISNIISRLQVFFPAIYMVTLPPDLLQAYLVELTNLTCRFCELAAEEELVRKDDKVFMEAYEHILDAWVTILQENQIYPMQVVKQSSIEIFNQYLKSHLSPPDGTRNSTPYFTKENIDEVEEDDRAKYRDQLMAIGMFGRHVMEHTIPVLIRLIEDRVTRLHGQLQRIHLQAVNSSDSSILENLNEDIHWIVLIIGHVLSCVSDGETSLIPQEVMQFCIKGVSSISIETTLQVLASPTHKVADIPGAEHSTDPVVRLISAVFRLCEVEKRALEANLSHLLSPELTLTIIWFLGRWSITYLLPNETYYTEMSVTLTQSFGRDSEAGLWTLNFLIGKLESNFIHWASESKVVTENAQALVSILNNTERGDKAMNCSNLISLIQKQTTGLFHTLPTAAKRSLLKALVIVGTANKQESTKEQYWNGLLKPLQDRFQMVVGQENFSVVYFHKPVMAEVSDLIECLTGVVDGCSMMNLSHLLPFINPLFEEIVKLIDIYHNFSNIVGMVFQVFNTAAKRILCFLNQTDSRNLYECCLTMIRIYAKHNSGKLTREANAEEEQYQDILVLMQLLTDLLSKDFIDFAPSASENSAECVSAADVALYGLNIIMPMMNTELLKFPSLCVQYFKLITFVCEIYPNKIHSLPTDLFKTLMSSVELGLNSFTAEVSALCLDFLSVLGVYLRRGGYQTSFAYEVLQPFLKLVLNMLLFEPLDVDLTQVASSTLFTLICCFQEKYQELVQTLISSQSDSTTAQKLATSFTNLTANISLSLDRYSRIQFRDNFEIFITEVRGYLCVK